MNAVHGRLNVLEQLWSELGTCSQDEGVFGTATNSENARLKLKVWPSTVSYRCERGTNVAPKFA